MSSNNPSPEVGPEDPFGPLGQGELFKIRASVCLEDLTTDQAVGDAVISIKDPETALLFAAGMADKAEEDKISDYVHSGSFAGAVIMTAIANEFGISIHRTTKENEDFERAMALWGPVLGMLKMAKSTPNMYEFLISGRDYSKSGGLEGPAYYDEKSYRKAQEEFSKILAKI